MSRVLSSQLFTLNMFPVQRRHAEQRERFKGCGSVFGAKRCLFVLKDSSLWKLNDGVISPKVTDNKNKMHFLFLVVSGDADVLFGEL